eukprot:6086936-Prymnesium_polylepis.2
MSWSPPRCATRPPALPRRSCARRRRRRAAWGCEQRAGEAGNDFRARRLAPSRRLAALCGGAPQCTTSRASSSQRCGGSYPYGRALAMRVCDLLFVVNKAAGQTTDVGQTRDQIGTMRDGARLMTCDR